jgi:DNA-binding IclR family transcriptional regulator
MNIRVGALLPIHLSATGLVFAANLREEVVKKAAKLQEHILPVTSGQKLNASQQREAYGQVRANGYAAVAGLSGPVPGVRAVAAPVHDHKGKVAVVIGLLGRDNDISLAGDSTHIRALLECAALASSRLGYDAPAID